MPLELAQSAGQGVRTDAGQGLVHLVEAVVAVEQFAHDQGGPRPVEQGLEPGDAALGEHRDRSQLSFKYRRPPGQNPSRLQHAELEREDEAGWPLLCRPGRTGSAPGKPVPQPLE
ncbi:hypothetical protein, partial [Streptomyces stelliscabiei]|uniref:hypothetical protein n=1 Tax=Streptomyces stelliscabiei TaxID=146820 RepID=UPI001F328B88